MVKKSYSGMKKVLAISIAVLFVVSLTAVAASALAGGYSGYRDTYYGGGPSILHQPYYHGHDYVNYDWVWDPSYASQYIWTY